MKINFDLPKKDILQKKYSKTKATLIKVAKMLNIDVSKIKRIEISFLGFSELTDESVLVLRNEHNNICWLRTSNFEQFYLDFGSSYTSKILETKNPKIKEIADFVKENINL